MPDVRKNNVTDLKMDLSNPRTVEQPDEISAIKQIISISSSKFYGIIHSLLEKGFLPIENLIVLNQNKKLKVLEGNRRLAAMKLILKVYPLENFILPKEMIYKIENLGASWIQANETVPCSIYEESEIVDANAIVSLMHAKGEIASRDEWNSIAKARYERDQKGIAQPALDILENYLNLEKSTGNLDNIRWSGEYPITVLEECLVILTKKTEISPSAKFVTHYGNLNKYPKLGKIIHNIGCNILNFKIIRDKDQDILEQIQYNFWIESEEGRHPTNTDHQKGKNPNSIDQHGASEEKQDNQEATKAPLDGEHAPHPILDLRKAYPTQYDEAKENEKASKTNTPSIDNPGYVKLQLESFRNKNPDSGKIIAIVNEMILIKISKTPLAFCFLLRSLIEISATEYCRINSIDTTSCKNLKQILSKAKERIVSESSNQQMIKKLHGAITELSKAESILSVNSLNQLVHNSAFSIQSRDICETFSNIFPFIQALNNHE